MKQNKLFDSHTHMNDEYFDEDRHEAIERARLSDISIMMNVGSSIKSSKECIELSEQYDFSYACVGVHPHSAKDWDENSESQLIEMLNHPKVMAIGEIGLDYYYDFSPKEAQKDVFIKQMEIAKRLSKKVVIHSRDAMNDTLEILKMFPEVKGVFHCYSGSLESAKIIVDMGYMLSFTGVITYKNAVKSLDVIKWAPLDMLMAETDAPYLTPVPFRGKRNETSYVKYVVEKMAEVKGLSYEEMAKITYMNGINFFNIKEN